jgi:thiamine pyrophosphokinase
MFKVSLPLYNQGRKVRKMNNYVAAEVDDYDWNTPLFLLESYPTEWPLSENTASSDTAATASLTKLNRYEYAMIILNAPIARPPSPLFDKLWKSACYRVCADGGANRLLLANTRLLSTPATDPNDDVHRNSNSNNSYYIPDVITGDLDSLTETAKNFFQSHNVRIERVIDQDRNDLDKAIAAVLTYGETSSRNHKPPIRCMVVYGAFGGRFDQEMASMQSLYKYPNLDLYLYDDHTMAFLLKPERTNHIRLALSSNASNDVGEGPVCGLIPLGCPVQSVTTTGLQWNLDHQPTQFGDLVSTSNRILEHIQKSNPTLDGHCMDTPLVTVRPSHPLVFTAQVHPGNKSVWSE